MGRNTGFAPCVVAEIVNTFIYLSTNKGTLTSFSADPSGTQLNVFFPTNGNGVENLGFEKQVCVKNHSCFLCSALQQML